MTGNIKLDLLICLAGLFAFIVGCCYGINRIENDWNKIFEDEIKRRDKTFN
jgi:hypothetical protein